MVMHEMLDGEGNNVLSINVDRRFPNRWREGPYFSDIKGIALRGLDSGVTGPKFLTWIFVGERRFLILPHQEIEIAKGEHAGVIMKVGPGQYERIRIKSKAHGEQLIEGMHKLLEEVDRNPALRAELMELGRNPALQAELLHMARSKLKKE